MSNLGVITLSYFKKNILNNIGFFKELKIEDNIGESIHIHIDNFRFDLTISEFNIFADCILDSLKNNFKDNILIKKKLIDDNFIAEIAVHLNYVENVIFEKIKIKELKVINYDSKNNIFINNIKSSFYFNRKKNSKSTEDKIIYFNNLLKNNKLQIDKQIVLFGKQNIIRDGQHRACVIFKDNPEREVIIKRVIFKKNYKKYLIKNYYIYKFIKSMYFKTKYFKLKFFSKINDILS